MRGQILHLVQEDRWFGVEIDGMADDLDAGPAHNVMCEFLATLRVDKVSAVKTEDRAVGEQLVQVGVGVAGWFLGLVLGVHDGEGGDGLHSNVKTSRCPRQDSNLRSRLWSALLCGALTWPYALNEAPWGAYGARERRVKRGDDVGNSVYTMRMARVNITLPDDLLNQARAAGLNVSRLAAAALAEELDRRAKINELDAYLADLDNELGPVPQHELRAAREWADAVLPAGREGTGQARSA